MGCSVKYCPLCGTKFPSDLTEARRKILKKEYNIRVAFGTAEDNIPAEFKTDEWWKKRKL